MNFFAHAIAERGIDQLVALDAAFTGELRGDDHGLEVLAVADHLQVLARKAAFDAAFYAVRGNQWRFSFYVLSLYPDLSSKRQAVATATKLALTSARLTAGATSEAPKKP